MGPQAGSQQVDRMLSRDLLSSLQTDQEAIYNLDETRRIREGAISRIKDEYQETMLGLSRACADVTMSLEHFDQAISSYLKINALLIVLSGRYAIPLAAEIEAECDAVQSQLLNTKAVLPHAAFDVIDTMQFRMGPGPDQGVQGPSNPGQEAWKKLQYTRLSELLSSQLPWYRSQFKSALKTVSLSFTEAAKAIERAAANGVIDKKDSITACQHMNSVQSIRASSAHAIPRIIQAYTAGEGQFKEILESLVEKVSTSTSSGDILPREILHSIALQLGESFDRTVSEQFQRRHLMRAAFFANPAGELWYCIARYQDATNGNDPFTEQAAEELSVRSRRFLQAHSKELCGELLDQFQQKEATLFPGSEGVVQDFRSYLKEEERRVQQQLKSLAHDTGIESSELVSILDGYSESEVHRLHSLLNLFPVLKEQRSSLCRTLHGIARMQEDEAIELIASYESLSKESPLVESLLYLSAAPFKDRRSIESEYARARLLMDEPAVSYEYWFSKIHQALGAEVQKQFPMMDADVVSLVLLTGFYDKTGPFVGSKRATLAELTTQIKAEVDSLSDRFSIDLDVVPGVIEELVAQKVLLSRRGRYSVMTGGSTRDESYAFREKVTHVVTSLWQSQHDMKQQSNGETDAMLALESCRVLDEMTELCVQYRQDGGVVLEEFEKRGHHYLSQQLAWRRYGVRTEKPYQRPESDIERRIHRGLLQFEQKNPEAEKILPVESMHHLRQKIVRSALEDAGFSDKDQQRLLDIHVERLESMSQQLSFTMLRLYHRGLIPSAKSFQKLDPLQDLSTHSVHVQAKILRDVLSDSVLESVEASLKKLSRSLQESSL